jgi:flagellar hook-associated protein 2
VAQKGGPLIGDATLASLKRSLQGAITTPVVGSPSILSEIGIATQKNGTLSIDGAKLGAALNSDLAGLGNLFTAAADGLARSIISFADDATRLGDGTLFNRIAVAQGEITNIQGRIDRQENSISRFAEELSRKFGALELLVSQINTQGGYFAQQLAALGGQLKK